MKPAFRSIVTVTLNPTIDRIVDVPDFQIGGHQQGRLRLREPAGKAINVSRALSDLGVPSTAVGWVGMNAFDLFHEAMQRCGVKACFLPITGATRENITIIDTRRHSETHIRDAGPHVDEADVRRLVDLIQTVVNAETLVVFTGSTPPGLRTQMWTQLLNTCLDRGASVMVDTAGEPLQAACELPLWMIKPNDLELGELLGESTSTEEAIVAAGRRLSHRFPVVLITVGRRGAYCFADGQALHAQATVNPDQVKSTVGCGDAMLAGFLSALLADEPDLASALSRGVAVSAAATLTEEPAKFERDDAERIARTVRVRSL